MLSSGATGALYTQITQGAPFEVFLSADNKRPAAGGRPRASASRARVFTYAVGKLVLYSPTLDVTDGEAVLKAGAFQHIAIADPKTAPYGAAAMEVMEALGVTAALTPKLVTGENITQTLQFVDSGNAELGFVALSQVIGKPAAAVAAVPADLYPPIVQDAVLLKTGESQSGGQGLPRVLQVATRQSAIIMAAGYEVHD